MALAPADPNVLIAAANLETALGNTDRAIELYRKAIELDPVNAQARSFLAFGLANRKRFAEARAEYARVIELNPSAPWAHAGLGLTYLLENKFEEAATEAQADAGEWARLLIVSLRPLGAKASAGIRRSARRVNQKLGRTSRVSDCPGLRISR